MVEWFYSFTYKLTILERSTSLLYRVLEGHSWMFTLADKYDIPNLKAHALARTQRFIGHPLTDNRLTFLSKELLAGTLHAFKNAPPTDDRLCKALVAGWVAHDKHILRHMDKKDLEAAMIEMPEFASALVAELGGFALKTKDQNDSGAAA